MGRWIAVALLAAEAVGLVGGLIVLSLAAAAGLAGYGVGRVVLVLAPGRGVHLGDVPVAAAVLLGGVVTARRLRRRWRAARRPSATW